MARTQEITALPKHPSKYDTERYEVNIVGTFNKGEMQHLIQRMDNTVHH